MIACIILVGKRLGKLSDGGQKGNGGHRNKINS
jgi:hypothetical protein